MRGRRVASPSRFDQRNKRARVRVQYEWATLLTRGGPSQFHAAAAPRGGRDATTRLTTARRARGRQTRNRLTHSAHNPEGLTRPQGDRGHKFMRTFVTRPDVPDATSEIECGFFGDQQNAAAAGTFRSAKIVRDRSRGIASVLDGHRRSSATLPRTPCIPMVCMMRDLCGVATTRL